ncbi:MAG TPA: trypsin-like peptidase domain-containing protein [Blastocatellia bacterium]|nr:trypsin-like peptidase domain-containing protein [Blastocatellia bacterium]
MERIVLRHMSGSKGRQVEEFPLSHFRELTFGRDPSATVKYDPERDDLVGRQHAKIVQDPADPTQFMIVDLNSRNGTFVNRQRIVGTAKIVPGDTVQFGAGGPEFQFDLEPRPQQYMRSTRTPDGSTAGFGSSSTSPPPTRMGTAPGPMMQGQMMPPTATAPPAYGSVGKATVERMIMQSKSEASKNTMKYLLIGGGALLIIIALVAGAIYYQSRSSSQQLASEIGATKEAVEKAAAGVPMTPAEIANAFSNSVVYIEAGWKLIYTRTGGQVYHRYIRNELNGRPLVPDGRSAVAAYILVDNDNIEPLLTLDSRQGPPIGGEHTGSGFAVTSDGFILTNRHVAATWKTSYVFPPSATPGVIIQNGGIALQPDGTPYYVNAPRNWVPAATKQAGQSLQGGFEGRNDYLNVTFARQELRFPATVARISDRHDAAMIKIQVPESVPRLELNDNYDTIKQGEAAIVLGYPGVAPPVYGVIRSQDVFNRESQIKIIPDPTISVGNIGRIIRGQQGDNTKDPIYSQFGDAYQLTINSTGAGNSGGPVFDDRGRVTGIFFAGGSAGGASITFAVPIRYGKELMSVTSSSR